MEPQPKSNLVHFSLKISQLLSTTLGKARNRDSKPVSYSMGKQGNSRPPPNEMVFNHPLVCCKLQCRVSHHSQSLRQFTVISHTRNFQHTIEYHRIMITTMTTLIVLSSTAKPRAGAYSGHQSESRSAPGGRQLVGQADLRLQSTYRLQQAEHYYSASAIRLIYYIYPFSEGGRLSRTRHCSKCAASAQRCRYRQ